MIDPLSEPVAGDRKWSRLSMLVLALLLASLLGNMAFDLGWMQERLLNVDLPSFYYGAAHSFAGESPYDPELLRSHNTEIQQFVFPYFHPPASTPLFYPLARVGYARAEWLMLVVNYLCVVGLVVVLLRLLRLRGAPFFVAVLVGCYLVSAFPVRNTLMHGQLNLVAALLLCIAWWAGGDTRGDLVAGLALAVAVLLKQSPIVLLFLFVALGRWRVVVSCAATLLVAIVTSLVLLPAELWAIWFREVAPTLGYGRTPLGLFEPASPYNQSLPAFFARLTQPGKWGSGWFSHPSLTAPLSWVACGVVLAASFLIVLYLRRQRPGSPATLDLGFALFLCAAFLTAPLSWQHHLVLILPVAAVALRLITDPEPAGASGALVRTALFFGLLLVAVRLPVDHWYLRSGWKVLVVSMHLYGVLALWGALTLVAWRHCRLPVGESHGEPLG